MLFRTRAKYVVAFAAPFLGYGAYSFVKSRNLYPIDVREPLRHALVIKHKNNVTKADVEEAMIAFDDAIQQARKHFRPDSTTYTGILVEAADFARSERGGLNYRYANEKYSQAMKGVLGLGSNADSLPVYLGRKKQFTEEEKEKISRASGIAFKLANLYIEVGAVSQAVTLFNWSIESLMATRLRPNSDINYMKDFGPVREQLGGLMDNLGSLYVATGNYEEALEVYQGLLNILYDERSGDCLDYCRTAHVMNSCANACEQLDRRHEAIKYLRKANELVEKAAWLQWIPFDFEKKEFCARCSEAIKVITTLQTWVLIKVKHEKLDRKKLQ